MRGIPKHYAKKLRAIVTGNKHALQRELFPAGKDRGPVTEFMRGRRADVGTTIVALQKSVGMIADERRASLLSLDGQEALQKDPTEILMRKDQYH